jgi:hypothetical protein
VPVVPGVVVPDGLPVVVVGASPVVVGGVVSSVVVVVVDVVVSSVGAVDSLGRLGSDGTGFVGPVVDGSGWVGRDGSTVPCVVVGGVWPWVVGTCATAAVAPPRINRLVKIVLRIEILLASSRRHKPRNAERVRNLYSSYPVFHSFSRQTVTDQR